MQQEAPDTERSPTPQEAGSFMSARRVRASCPRFMSVIDRLGCTKIFNPALGGTARLEPETGKGFEANKEKLTAAFAK